MIFWKVFSIAHISATSRNPSSKELIYIVRYAYMMLHGELFSDEMTLLNKLVFLIQVLK